MTQLHDNDAPAFTPDAWNKDFVNADLWGSNCYQYAAAGSKPDGSNQVFNEAIPNPGELGGYKLTKDSKNPVTETNRVFQGLEADGIKSLQTTSSELPPKKDNHYLIGVYVAGNWHDFHFVRQDSDGGWSHKPGTGAPIERLREPNANGSYAPLPQNYGDYTLVGYGYVPQKGIDLGPEKLLRDDIHNCKDVHEDFYNKGKESYKLYDTLINKYGKESIACAASGGKDVTLENYMECNYSNHSAIDMRQSEQCGTLSK